MKSFRRITATAVPLARADIDTDAMVPQQWLITTEREGLGKALFANWRYRDADMQLDAGFVLNQPRFAGARIVVAGPNYGCGSSREHAVWAHLDYGIEAVVAPSFGPIFLENALRNGLAAVQLRTPIVEELLATLQAAPTNQVTVDLEAMLVIGPDGQAHSFSINAERREALLEGRDDIASTLAFIDEIEAFERQDRLHNPWYWSSEISSQTRRGQP